MFALLIIPLLVSGCLIATSPNNFKLYFKLHRYDGQLLYMKAATYGTFAVLFSIFFAYTVKFIFPDIKLVTWTSDFIDFSKDYKSNRAAAWLILLSLASIIFSIIYLLLIRLANYLTATALLKLIKSNGIFKDASLSMKNNSPNDDAVQSLDFYKQAIRLSALASVLPAGSLGRLFFDSATKRKNVLITLKSRKVYVGRVKTISEPNEIDSPSQEISIIPLMSGYREKDTLRIFFINDYDGLDSVDTGIVIPTTEICHASWFNMDIHKEVDNNREKKAIENSNLTNC
ncbi:hypothetical protein PEC301879_31390 [Pectobacterium carotovorum subsp. carotovorum]|nr:hypothetical protein PEC301879_31390 [Pectobacterium carotovorum subsp. carotovorum]